MNAVLSLCVILMLNESMNLIILCGSGNGMGGDQFSVQALLIKIEF